MRGRRLIVVGWMACQLGSVMMVAAAVVAVVVVGVASCSLHSLASISSSLPVL